MGGPGSFRDPSGVEHVLPSSNNYGASRSFKHPILPISCCSAEAAFQALKFIAPRRVRAAAAHPSSTSVGGAGAAAVGSGAPAHLSIADVLPVYESEGIEVTNKQVMEAVQTPASAIPDTAGLEGSEFDLAAGQWFWKQGQSAGMRPDWSAVKMPYMFFVNAAKVQQHADVAAELEATGSARIWFDEESTEWGHPKDTPRDKAENWNGRNAMALRELLRPAGKQDSKLLAAFFTLMARRIEAGIARLRPEVAAVADAEAKSMLAHVQALIALLGGPAEHAHM